MGKQLLLGRRPKPALLFLIAEKEGKKASPLGTYKTYFEPGVLQLPTVGQIKRLYIPFKINFIGGFKGVRLTANNNGKPRTTTANRKRQGPSTTKNKGEKAQKKYKNTHCLLNRLGGER
ncbi:hypothetical protein [Candidatus Avelusimicrobium faecicola]|uniref:hypothetical protein n=1 Tax=Candidatus Avelusimicrobium faecicola TaxID=3416205 RepID=UPI003D0D3530